MKGLLAGLVGSGWLGLVLAGTAGLAELLEQTDRVCGQPAAPKPKEVDYGREGKSEEGMGACGRL